MLISFCLLVCRSLEWKQISFLSLISYLYLSHLWSGLVPRLLPRWLWKEAASRQRTRSIDDPLIVLMVSGLGALSSEPECADWAPYERIVKIGCHSVRRRMSNGTEWAPRALIMNRHHQIRNVSLLAASYTMILMIILAIHRHWIIEHNNNNNNNSIAQQIAKYRE